MRSNMLGSTKMADRPVGRAFPRDASALLLLLALILPFAGCKSPGKQPAPAVHLIWPDPPETARVAYEQSLSQPADFGIKRSALSKFAGFFTGTSKGIQSFEKPFAVALDEADNLCLTDTGANTVWFFDLKEKHARNWSAIGKLRFMSPVGIAKRGDRIFVADSGLGTVIAFDLNGKLVYQITENLARPVALAISGEKLFVVDSQQNSIGAFELSTGKFLYRFGRRGAGKGEFNFPTHISISADGTMLITDSMNGRIQTFDSEGPFKGVI